MGMVPFSPSLSSANHLHVASFSTCLELSHLKPIVASLIWIHICFGGSEDGLVFF
ncbi:unnamed protein product, partial [Arabidopsis halleri]